MPEGPPPQDETARLLLSLTGGLVLVCTAVVAVCLLGGVRWQVVTSSYQVFLIGMFCGALVTSTLVLSTLESLWVSRAGMGVFLLGILVTGTAQVFFFHLLGGTRYVERLMRLFGEVWG